MTNTPDDDSTAAFKRKMDELRAHPVHAAKKKLDDIQNQGEALADNLEMLGEAIKNLKRVMATKLPGQSITQEEQGQLKELEEKSNAARLSINKLEKEYIDATKDHALKNANYIETIHLRNAFNGTQIRQHLIAWDNDIESAKNPSFLQHCSHGFKQQMTSFWEGLKQLIQGFIEKIIQSKSENKTQKNLVESVNDLISDCFNADDLEEDLDRKTGLRK